MANVGADELSLSEAESFGEEEIELEERASDKGKTLCKSKSSTAQKRGDPKPDLTEVIATNNEVLRHILEKMSGGKSKKRKRRACSSSSSSSSSSQCSDSSELSDTPAKPSSSRRKRMSKRYKSQSQTGTEEKSCNPTLEGTEGLGSEDVINDILHGGLDGTLDNSQEGEIHSDDAGESIVKAASEEYAVKDELGEPVSAHLAKFVNQCFGHEMETEKLKEKSHKYKKPSNCSGLTVRMTNKTIWDILKPINKKVDAKHITIQRLLAKATMAILESASLMTKVKGRNKETKEALSCMLDAMAFIGTAQQKMTSHRKMTQRMALPFDIRALAEQPSDGTDWLYGEDVKQKIKDIKEQKRLAVFSSPYPKMTYNAFGSNSTQRKERRPFLGKGMTRGGWNQRPAARGHYRSAASQNKAKRGRY